MGQGGKDDDDQLESVHALSTNDIGKSTEANLPEDSPSRSCNLDGRVGTGIDRSWLTGIVPVDDSQHVRHQADSKDIVGIGEEPDSSDDDGPNMVPSERGLVNFGESKSSSLIRVSDMGVVIVKVVECSIATTRLLCHDYWASVFILGMAREMDSEKERVLLKHGVITSGKSRDVRQKADQGRGGIDLAV